MNKAPIIAIASSVAILFLVYVFTDIKPNKEKEISNIKETSNVELNDFVENYNHSLDSKELENVNSYLSEANSSNYLADSLIKFYEIKQQFNIAAYYHNFKAELLNTSEAWELAGDRQMSVSKNDAYDATFNQQLFQNSLDAYHKALEIDTNNLDLKVKLGSALVGNSEQPMQGITYLLEVVQKDSMNLNANFALGKFGIISGQYDKAIIRLEKVLALQPENTEALFLSAEAYDNLGQTKEAIASLEKCKQLVQNEELKNEIDAYLQQLILK